MLTEQVQIILDSINTTTKTISIAKDTVVFRDGVEISRERHRTAFVPGQIEEVKTYIGETSSPEIDYLNAIWTEQAIADYQTLLASQNEQ